MDYCNYFDNLFLSFENDTDVLQNDTDVLVTSRLQIVYFRIDALGFLVAKLHHFRQILNFPFIFQSDKKQHFSAWLFGF